MEISVIIPAYNEEERISATLEKIWIYFKKKQLPFELIIVNDGSIDNTEKVVKNFSSGKNNIVYIKNKENYGKGDAIKKGGLYAKGKYILFTDADLSTPIEEFEKFYKFAKKGYDVVIGTRRVKRSKILRKQPFLRRFFGTGFIFLVKAMFPQLYRITDFTCGFKLFRSEKGKKIFKLQRIKRWGFDVEILLIAKILKCKIKEIPVTWRDLRKSKVNLKKDIIRSFIDLITIKMLLWKGYYRYE